VIAFHQASTRIPESIVPRKIPSFRRGRKSIKSAVWIYYGTAASVGEGAWVFKKS
jgi:hypothetical protein